MKLNYLVIFFALFLASVSLVQAQSKVKITKDSVVTNDTKQIIGYLPNWSLYRRNRFVQPKIINYSKYTIINYSFFYPDEYGKVKSCDPYADRFLLNGDYNVVSLAHQKGVKVMISMGGWTLSHNFSKIAGSPELRQIFAQECVRVLKEYNFDGIDIDWEYPTSERIGGEEADTQNFTLLLQEIRKAIDEYGKEVGQQMLLTAAMGAAEKHFEKIQWTAVSKVLDYINLMTYATNGVWSELSGHNSPLFGDDTTDCIANSINQLTTKYKVPISKINLGIAFYGSTLMFPKGKADLGSPEHLHCKDTAGYFEVTKGNPSYYDIVQHQDHFHEHWDSVAASPYLISKDSSVFVTYDNVESVTQRAKFANEVGAAGVIVWEITNDYLETETGSGILKSTPLADAVFKTLMSQQEKAKNKGSFGKKKRID